MSGLLPRTGGSGSASFTSLSLETLTVSISAFINSLTVSALNVTNLVLNSITTSTINGSPDLNIVANSATVGGDDIVTLTAAQTVTNKTLTTGDNSIIMSGIAGTPEIQDVVDQDLRTTASPTFAGVNSPSVTSSAELGLNATSVLRLRTAGTERLNISASGAITVSNSTGITLPTTGVPACYCFGGAGLNGMGYALVPTNWFNDSVAGDIVVRAGAANRLLLGAGSTGSTMILTTTNARVNTAMQINAANVSLDNTATNILALQGDNVVRCNDIVDTSSAQTLTNKTLTAPTISTITNGGTVTIPAGTDTLVNLNGTQTLTDKTLTMPNISTVRTQNTPFSVDTQNAANGFININSNLSNINVGARFLVSNVETAKVYTNGLTKDLNLESGNLGSLRFSTNLGSNPQLVIPSTGLAVDDTGEILARNAGSLNLVRRSDVVTLAGSQTLTNKTLTTPAMTNPSLTLNAGATFNLLTLSAGNVMERRSDITDQQLRAADSVNFASVTTTGAVNIGTQRFTATALAVQNVTDTIDYSTSPMFQRKFFRFIVAGSSSGNIVWSYALPTSCAATIDSIFTGWSGINDGSGSYHYAHNFRSLSGVVTNGGALYTDKREQGANAYGGKLGVVFDNSGSTVRIVLSNTAAYQIFVSGYVDIILYV